ncbi:hypothetical protein CISG_10219 [Coccidioides immitis RMSCC 3703]|uniref:Uncharacterized protein n=1 Tax=Coccidioides immitis RMSCC 3703 TaxID=454286 RepID=A0A0J8TJD2_COCIT|nr:hypothetical protein CISG_10219 [Coccidioides immitis RMSCC 3703]
MGSEPITEISKTSPIEGYWFHICWPPSRKQLINLEPSKECDTLEDFITDTGFGKAPVICNLSCRQYDIFVCGMSATHFAAVSFQLEVKPFDMDDALAQSLGKLKAAKHTKKELETLLETGVLPGTEQAIQYWITFYAEIKASLIHQMTEGLVPMGLGLELDQI